MLNPDPGISKIKPGTSLQAGYLENQARHLATSTEFLAAGPKNSIFIPYFLTSTHPRWVKRVLVAEARQQRSPNFRVFIFRCSAYNMLKRSNALTKVVQMSSSPVTRAPYPEHPNRCQGSSAAKGQCPNLAVEGGKHCTVHGGSSTLRAAKKKEQHRYDVAKWRDKIARHAEDDDIKNLNAEIGVLRMMLETQLAACQNDIDLITNSPVIADMLMKVDKLVNSCHRLEDKMGHLLDKSAIIAFAAQVVEIISNEVEDPNTVAKIADKITGALAKDTNDVL